jgi:muconate cycloisomerase
VRITEITAFHIRVPLLKRVKHAAHTRKDTENLVIACRLDDGIVGFGEGVPREYVTGETIDSTLALLGDMDWSAVTGLQASRDFAEAVRQIETIRLPVVPEDARDIRGNATRCALELALLDACGRHWKQPLREVTRLLAPELWEPRERVQYSAAITSAKGAKASLRAWVMRFYGFKQLKVKVGIEGLDDVDRLRRIRKGVGRAMDIRIDANEAYTPAEVVDRIREFEPFAISSVEQPLPHEHLGCLAEARKYVKPKIMLDESLCGLGDAQEAVGQGACDLFNLRLSKCGGFIPSLRLAQYARQHGIGYQLGCQIGETMLLSAAGRHFASSVRELRHVEGSYDHRLLKDNLGKHLQFGYGGWAPALQGHGLAVGVDPAALERLTVRKEVLLG